MDENILKKKESLEKKRFQNENYMHVSKFLRYMKYTILFYTHLFILLLFAIFIDIFHLMNNI